MDGLQYEGLALPPLEIFGIAFLVQLAGVFTSLLLQSKLGNMKLGQFWGAVFTAFFTVCCPLLLMYHAFVLTLAELDGWKVVVLLVCALPIFSVGGLSSFVEFSPKPQVQPELTMRIGTQITKSTVYMNEKPIARFAQKFEMLDKVVPLKNGQILTFFAPTISIEYLSGDKEPIELPRATFQEVAAAVDHAIQSNPKQFAGWEPLRLKSDARNMFEDNTEAEKEESTPRSG